MAGLLVTVQGNHGEVLPKELSTFAARLLARRFLGDPASADWGHYGRLAGFTNRKEKYRKENGLFPFVLLHEASGRPYRRASEFLPEIEELFKAAKTKRVSENHPMHFRYSSPSLKTIEDFRQRSVYGGDHTRSDLAYAVYALAHGIPESNLRQQLASRDSSHKGNTKRQQEYLERTLLKARIRVKEVHSARSNPGRLSWQTDKLSLLRTPFPDSLMLLGIGLLGLVGLALKKTNL